jgi:hypothetical protein
VIRVNSFLENVPDEHESEDLLIIYGERWLGDLIYGLSLIQKSEMGEDADQIAQILGFTSRKKNEAQTGEESPPEDSSKLDSGEEPAPDLFTKVDRIHTPLEARGQEGSDPREDLPIPYRIAGHRPPQTTEGEPYWISEAKPLPSVGEESLKIRPEFEPLFEPNRSRAILSTALSTPLGEGPLDIETIVESIIGGKPIRELPRLPIPTLRLGLQLLIDLGQGMMPYARDQEQVVKKILHLAGSDRVQLLRFADSPLRGSGPGSRFTWKRSYFPPQPGTPVVVLTDLGISRKRDSKLGVPVEEWLEFARRVHTADCPLLALVPYGEKRWPDRLCSVMSILEWNRTASVGTVRKAVGKGLEVTK